ncbi:hypothetical protein BGZ97_011846 [Linnemannia gamsii]|uniref:Uncharacterized protein n=1 Tax=Linnemannia gamsii TaxID=64522 RepID=A0A9P6ULC1_9FUNG|nr:hypothetical protein BGZ97_011846 [Linnemannia gamsii]
MAFTFLSSLLTKLYPVQPTYLDAHLQTIDPGTILLQTTSLTPGSTNAESILSAMGFSLKGAKFHSYSQTPPPPKLCTVVDTRSVNCSGDIWEDSTTQYEDLPVIFGHNRHGLTDDDERIRNGTTQSGQDFKYFNASATDHGGAVVDAYNFLDFSSIRGESVSILDSSRSLEACLFRGYDTRRCVQHSLSYFVLSTRDLIGLISTRTVFQSVYDKSDPCDHFSTPTLRTKCGYLVSLDHPERGQMYTTQQRTLDPDGHLHWEIVSQYSPYNHPYIEAFSLDVSITMYNITMDYGRWTEAVEQFISSADPSQYLGEKVFEATYFVPKTLDPSNHTWASWGFSPNDLDNLTHFLLGGTLINNGTVSIMPPLQLAYVSEAVIGLLFGASLIMFALGLGFSRGTPSIVRKPISEVLYEAMTTKKEGATLPAVKSSSTLKRRVAHLKLVPQLARDKEQGSGRNTPDHQSPAEQAQQPRPPRQRRRTIVLHVEIDTDNEDEDMIQLLETR